MKLVVRNSGKTNRRLYIQKSVRKNGKCTSLIVESLGILSELMKEKNMSEDEVIAWGEKRARELTSEKSGVQKDVTVRLSQTAVIRPNEKRTFRCGQLYLQDIYSKMRFRNIFRNITARNTCGYDAESIFSDLVFARILEPGSKRSSYRTAMSFIEAPKYSEHQIYRALSLFSRESDYILGEIYRNSRFLVKRSSHVLYYDCTNYYFETEEEDDFRKYGKSKENRPSPIVQMGLFMDSDGLPLTFSLFEGNRNEQLSLKPLEQKVIRDFGMPEIVVCTDAGLAGAENRFFNSVGGRSYIATQSLKKLKKDDRSWALDRNKPFTEVGSGTETPFADMKKDRLYYREEPLPAAKIRDQRLIVTYSPVYAVYQKQIREKQVARASGMIESGKLRKNRRNPNDPARFVSEISVTDSGEVAENEVYSLDRERIAEEEKYDGFYGIVTNLEDDVKDIIAVSEGRWEIEESFRILKTDFSARPVYLQRTERISAHFLICFTALLIFRILEKKLGGKYTASGIIQTLRNCRHLKLEGAGYIPEFERTDLTDDLEKVFGLGLDREIITPASMRSIVKKSKEMK